MKDEYKDQQLVIEAEQGQVLEGDDDSDEEEYDSDDEEDDDSEEQDDEEDGIEDEGQGGDREGGNARINDEDVRGRVVVLDSSTDYGFWRSGGGVKLARALPVLERHGVVGMIVIGVDYFKNSKFDTRPFTISEPSIPIMLVPKAAAGALKAPNATMTAFPGV